MTDDLRWISRLHNVVDELAATVAAFHSLTCKRGCAGCCSDGLTVFEIEAARIRDRHAALLENFEPHESGCAFLDEAGGCRVYEVRPYVCRTQGLPLRWLEEDNGEAFEARDVCALNLDGIDLAALAVEAMWTIGPIEERLATRGSARVELRSLFSHSIPAKRRLPVVR